MPRMVILGAGASQACPNNDPNLPMPLLRDLPAVVSHAEPESDWHHFGKTLNGLLQATDGDIEVLLTILYRFNEAFFVPRKQYTLDPGFIDQILASSALPGFFPVPDEANQATSVLRRLRGSIAAWPAAASSFSPQNFFTMFQGILRQYFQASFRRYPCPYHLRLFEQLRRFDTVVSFNYDLIADYTLFSAGKLASFSFEGLGFTEIALPERPIPQSTNTWDEALSQVDRDRFNCVTFLKVHGSFIWFTRRETVNVSEDHWVYPVGPPPPLRQSSVGGPEVLYCLGNPTERSSWRNWTMAPVIFPFLTKDYIYRSNAMFARHIIALQYELGLADEIYLVGKNFQNADREMNGIIRYATFNNRRRTIHIIDRNPSADFDTFHCALFNAELGQRYGSFEQYWSSHGR